MYGRTRRLPAFLILGLALGSLGLGGALLTRSLGAVGSQPSGPLPIAWVPPPAVVQISPCVPTMGEHWANPADLPTGPIYTVHNGRLISVEYMLTQADLAAGQDWTDRTFRYWDQPLPIDHADIEFLPAGHEGFAVPHYDMHFHVVPHAVDRAITCQ